MVWRRRADSGRESAWGVAGELSAVLGSWHSVRCVTGSLPSSSDHKASGARPQRSGLWAGGGMFPDARAVGVGKAFPQTQPPAARRHAVASAAGRASAGRGVGWGWEWGRGGVPGAGAGAITVHGLRQGSGRGPGPGQGRRLGRRKRRAVLVWRRRRWRRAPRLQRAQDSETHGTRKALTPAKLPPPPCQS